MAARREVIALLEAWLAEARAGNVREIYVLGKDAQGEWDDAYCAGDPDDLMLELRTARLRVMRDCNTEPTTTQDTPC